MPEDVVKRARQLLNNATPAPWYWHLPPRTTGCKTIRYRIKRSGNPEICTTPGYLGDTGSITEAQDAGNADLIAAAPELVEELCNEIVRLRKLVSTMSLPAGD